LCHQLIITAGCCNCTQDFIALDRAVPASEVDYEYLAQFPLAGNGLAMAYNLPQLNSTDPTLVFLSSINIYLFIFI
jgi:ABC-type phosphate transport system substrate-binding protein